MHVTSRCRCACKAPDCDAIQVMRRQLGLTLADSCRLSAKMTGAELDTVEAAQSPVEVAALIYQAQLRWARRIADPELQRRAVWAAREDAKRHQATIEERVVIRPPSDEPPRESGPRVYPTPPQGAAGDADA
jgi:hypothetical protein